MTLVHRDLTQFHLPHQSLIRTQQQLLSSLSARIKRSRHLRAAERSVRKQSAIFARKRDALRNALIDDAVARLRQTIDVCLASAIVATFDRVIEQPVDRIAIVGIILRCVDATLRCNTVRATSRIKNAERLYVVSELRKRCSRRCAREPRTYDDD